MQACIHLTMNTTSLSHFNSKSLPLLYTPGCNSPHHLTTHRGSSRFNPLLQAIGLRIHLSFPQSNQKCRPRCSTACTPRREKTEEGLVNIPNMTLQLFLYCFSRYAKEGAESPPLVSHLRENMQPKVGLAGSGVQEVWEREGPHMMHMNRRHLHMHWSHVLTPQVVSLRPQLIQIYLICTQWKCQVSKY